MSKFDDAIELYKKAFKEKLKRRKYDEDLLVAIAKSLGPSIYNKDAAKVSCSSKKEREKIKKSFLIKKLGLADDPSLEEAIIEVCQKMGTSNRNKYRPVFYYLLVEKFEKQALFITVKQEEKKAKTTAKRAKVKNKAKATTSEKKSSSKTEEKRKERNTTNISTTTEEIIQKHALGAAVAGLVPIPLVDMVAISGVQYKMIKRLSEEYDHVDFKEEKTKSIIAVLMGGLGSFEAGLFTRILFKGIPFFGPIIGGTAVSGFAYYSTKLIGDIFDQHFGSVGTMAIEDLTMEKMKETFRFNMKKWRTSTQ